MKGKISAEKGWEASLQKLIYSGSSHMLPFFLLPPSSTYSVDIGKILQDQNTVESYNIEEKGFIVCMVSKVRRSSPRSTVGTYSDAINH